MSDQASSFTSGTGSIADDPATLSIDIESRLRQFFTSDAATGAVIERVAQTVGVAVREAYFASCVGLPFQIPLSEIYQASRLYREDEQDQGAAGDFLEPERDRLVLAGPGLGKTTLLNYVLIEVGTRRGWLPLLFVLRLEGVLPTLLEFMSALRSHKDRGLIPGAPVLLLVDGFDEISLGDRHDLVKSLREFQRLHYGHFYLSGRLNYELGPLNSLVSLLRPFDRDDAIRYSRCLFRYSKKEIDAVSFIDSLITRGLFDLIRVPLLLSLACVIKVESAFDIPTNIVELLDQAIELLNDKWDRVRRVKGRDSIAGIGSRRRLLFLKRVAYLMPGRQAPESWVSAITTQFLTEAGLTEVDPSLLLNEVIQVSGLIRRTPDRRYEFMHAAIQDFLAAKYIVESGQFFPGKVSNWDARAGFAACLSGNATQSMIWALRHGVDNVAFNDCLLNGASFDSLQVAREIVRQLRRAPVRIVVSSIVGKDYAEVRLGYDFVSLARNDLVDAILAAALFDSARTSACDVLVGYCLLELKRRKRKVEPRTLEALTTAYGSLDFAFVVHKGSTTIRIQPKELL
jgi:hypothetical protein